MKFDFVVSRNGSIDPTDKALYAAIASFVDTETRESPHTQDFDLNGIPLDVPTRARLAECIGRSVDTVDRSTKRLEALGLLRVHRQADPDNPKRMLPSEYELLDHEMWDQRAAERVARRAERDASETSPSSRGGRMGAAGGGRMGAAVKEVREVEEEKGEEKASSTRSVVDGRSPSTSGSRDARGEGGSAASGKTKPSPTTPKTPAAGKKRHTTAELGVVRQVRAYYPPEFGNELPELPTISDAILSAMATDGRTAEQVGERILYRWLHHGYADKYAAGTLDNPIGAAVGMVRPLRHGDRYACPDARCENGRDIDTGEDCRLCAVRIADRKAAQQLAKQPPAASTTPAPAMPAQRAPEGRATPPVKDCTGPYCNRAIPTAGGDLCSDCLESEGATTARPAPF
ncbi:hypothetical protein [Streptomyces sp. NPDC008121]|uniref:hypothetical protein n=1 Tax=Streptomyces sp. NPDC008121 TaxID=3364809 RepID=UPI0036E33626